MTTEEDKRYIQRLRVQLVAGLQKVPPGYADWSHNRSVEFKACIVRCKKTVAKQRATEHELISAINALGVFWG